jgi:hypothetical protein
VPRRALPEHVTRRLRAQRLTGPPAQSPQEVTRDLLAVQAQDLRGARLSVRARSTGLTTADVDAALADGSLVVSWFNRGTLHLVAAEDHWWLHSLTTPQQATGNRRRLEQEGVSPEQASRGVDVVAAAVADGAALTRPELKAVLDEAGVPTAPQALVHVLMAATIAGHLVRGPMAGREQAFVDATRWVGPRPADLDTPDGQDEALARLARRYLVGHGPGTEADLAKWAGITLGAARRGLAAVAGELDDLGDLGDGLLDIAGRCPPTGPDATPGPRLHGPFDPLLLGWASRADWVGSHEGIVTTNGIFRPFALVDGRVVALWSINGRRLSLSPLSPVGRRDLAALQTDAADVQRYLGLPESPMAVAAP